jgi:hypothetical protein
MNRNHHRRTTSSETRNHLLMHLKNAWDVTRQGITSSWKHQEKQEWVVRHVMDPVKNTVIQTVQVKRLWIRRNSPQTVTVWCADNVIRLEMTYRGNILFLSWVTEKMSSRFFPEKTWHGILSMPNTHLSETAVNIPCLFSHQNGTPCNFAQTAITPMGQIIITRCLMTPLMKFAYGVTVSGACALTSRITGDLAMS